MNTLKDLLIGLKVRATKDCYPARKGEVYTVGFISGGYLYIGETYGYGCSCLDSWEPLDDIEIKKHKHVYKPAPKVCECGDISN